MVSCFNDVSVVNNYLTWVVRSDGEWEAPYSYWNATEFLAWYVAQLRQGRIANH